jgi:hypothetical protein
LSGRSSVAWWRIIPMVPPISRCASESGLPCSKPAAGSGAHNGARDRRGADSRQGHAEASRRPAGGYSCCPSERRDGGWRGSARAVAIEGERLTSRAMASDKIGHHSNLLTYRVPNSSMHWPPKKTTSPSMPIAARTVHLGHGMAMSRICAGNRSIFQHGTWVPRNRPP